MKTKENLKNQQLNTKRGITLVALVVTVIVLLILAGVVVSIGLDGEGLFGKSQNAVANYNNRVAEEDSALSNYLAQADQYLTQAKGPYDEYTIGQEVYLINNGNDSLEYFFVLEDSDSHKDTVTLFAKYNLSKESEPYQTETVSDYLFASSNYWRDEWYAYYDDEDPGWDKTNPNPPLWKWTKEKLNLNNLTPESSNDVIEIAREYAKRMTGDESNNSGRLITYEEAIALENEYEYMIFGLYSSAAGFYWTASAMSSPNGLPYSDNSINLYCVDQYEGCCDYVVRYDFSDGIYGLRPVLTVPKSLVHLAIDSGE